MSPAISYDDVLRRLREAEDVIETLLGARADAVVSQSGVHFLRLQETDRALHFAHDSLRQLLDERTQDLLRANAKLAASEARFRALLESAPEAIVTSGADGRIVLVNSNTEQMFGYNRQELAGAPLELLVPAGTAEIQKARPEELTGRRKDGSEFPVEVSVSVAEANGELLTLALITDVTDRKRIEAQLRETQKLESAGLLAGGVAHDFNNLLTAILGNASLLSEQVSAEAQPLVDTVISGAQKAALVARQLLAYAGKGKFEIVDLDLSSLVRENAALIRASIPKRIEIQLDLESNLPRVHADAGQLQQVIMNLVINGAEAIGENAGVITVSTATEQLTDHTSLAGGRYVRVTVTDTGCGMDDVTKDRIFDPFFTTKTYGRGLGLSAVLGIVRSCAATIAIESAPGRGTTFRLLFPAVETALPSPAPQRQETGARTGTVLVVDDEDGVRSFTSAALQRSGYRVLEASHGRQALDLLRNNGKVDIVLLDLTMPVMSGRETFEQMQALRPNLAVVITSGYSSEEAYRLVPAADGTEPKFLQKPYTPRQLLECIDTALQEL